MTWGKRQHRYLEFKLFALLRLLLLLLELAARSVTTTTTTTTKRGLFVEMRLLFRLGEGILAAPFVCVVALGGVDIAVSAFLLLELGGLVVALVAPVALVVAAARRRLAVGRGGGDVDADRAAIELLAILLECCLFYSLKKKKKKDMSNLILLCFSYLWRGSRGPQTQCSQSPWASGSHGRGGSVHS